MSATGLIADMGTQDSEHTIEALSRSTASQQLQLLIHGGDISYADDHFPADHNYIIWQDFMEDVEPIAGYIPYMTVPGNHEAQFEFAAYQNWLHMPSDVGKHKSVSPFYYS